MRGSERHEQLAEELAVVVDVVLAVDAPRYILRLPTMWATTKPIR